MQGKLEKNELGILISAAFFSLLFFTSNASANISGILHDFTNLTWGSHEACKVCHAPHNAEATQIIPLWNHKTTTATFTLYTSPTLNAAPSQPGTVSKACLSCHDGTVAKDAYGGGQAARFMTGPSMVGTDRSNDHPVAITYDSAVAASDGQLAVPQGVSTVDGTLPLFNGRIECSTCHDVHNSFNNEEDFIIVKNTGSALCFRCHTK